MDWQIQGQPYSDDTMIVPPEQRMFYPNLLPQMLPEQGDFPQGEQLRELYNEEAPYLRELQAPLPPPGGANPEITPLDMQQQDQFIFPPNFLQQNQSRAGSGGPQTQDGAVARVRSLIRLSNRYPMQLNQVLSEERPAPQEARSIRGGMPAQLFEHRG